MGKGKHGGYVSDAQRKAVHASRADGGKGAPGKMTDASYEKQNRKMRSEYSE